LSGEKGWKSCCAAERAHGGLLLLCLFNEKAGAVLSKPNQQQPFIHILFLLVLINLLRGGVAKNARAQPESAAQNDVIIRRLANRSGREEK